MGRACQYNFQPEFLFLMIMCKYQLRQNLTLQSSLQLMTTGTNHPISNSTPVSTHKGIFPKHLVEPVKLVSGICCYAAFTEACADSCVSNYCIALLHDFNSCRCTADDSLRAAQTFFRRAHNRNGCHSTV